MGAKRITCDMCGTEFTARLAWMVYRQIFEDIGDVRVTATSPMSQVCSRACADRIRAAFAEVEAIDLVTPKPGEDVIVIEDIGVAYTSPDPTETDPKWTDLQNSN